MKKGRVSHVVCQRFPHGGDQSCGEANRWHSFCCFAGTIMPVRGDICSTTTSLELNEKSIVKNGLRDRNPNLRLTSRSIVEPEDTLAFSSRHGSIDYFNLSAVLLSRLFHQALRASYSVVRRSCCHWRMNRFSLYSPAYLADVGPMVKPRSVCGVMVRLGVYVA